jgi:Ca2+-binding RTX toxin-like protein
MPGASAPRTAADGHPADLPKGSPPSPAVLSAEQVLAQLPALAPAAKGRPLNLEHLLKAALEKIKITLTVPEGAGTLLVDGHAQASSLDVLYLSGDTLHLSGSAKTVQEILAHLRYLPQHEGKTGLLHFSLWDGDTHARGTLAIYQHADGTLAPFLLPTGSHEFLSIWEAWRSGDGAWTPPAARETYAWPEWQGFAPFSGHTERWEETLPVTRAPAEEPAGLPAPGSAAPPPGTTAGAGSHTPGAGSGSAGGGGGSSSTSNAAPVVLDLPKAGTEDINVAFAAADFTAAFADVELDALTKIRIDSPPANGTLELGGAPVVIGQEIAAADLGTLTFVPNADWNGAASFQWSGHDGSQYSAAPANVNLTLANVNDAPTVANAIADQNATEDAAFSFQFNSNVFPDADLGDTLTYTAALAGGGALPAWLSFNAGTRTFSGTPANGDVGTISVKVTADDGNGGTVDDTFDLVVANTNDAPTVANAIADQNAMEDVAFNFQFAANTFADVDVGDTLTYSATLAGGGALPGWLSFNAGTRTFSGTPANGDVGTISMKVTADDGNGGTVDDTFDLVVADSTLLTASATDNLPGSGGADAFTAADAAHWHSTDTVPGGAGADSLTISGGTVNATLDTGSYDDISSVETIALNSDQAHVLTIGDAYFTWGGGLTGNTLTVTSTATTLGITINGSGVLAGHKLNLTGGGFDDILNGGADNDTLNGGIGKDNITGGDGADTINGGAGTDTLDGGAGNDTLSGSGSSDQLNGGANNDTLTGGASADEFVFDQTTAGHDDHITDFRNAGLADVIALSDAVFVFASGDGGKNGVALTDNTDIFDVAGFAGGNFAAGGGATFLYDTTDGQVWYDADGQGGVGAAVLIATVDNFAAYVYSATDFIGWT